MFLLILAIARVAAAAGIRAESDFAASGEFAYLTTDLQAVLLDDALSVGGGFVLISNWSGARYGLRVLGALDGEHLSLGLLVSYSPPQDRRGWLAGEPRLGGHLELGRVVLDGEVRVGLRRIDVATNAGGSISIDQVQVEAEAVATIDERWHVALDGIRSIYDPSLTGRGVRGADLGPAVTLAGRPESWALGARAGRRLGEHFRLEAGLTGVAYADGPGAGLVPRAAIRAGPWGGFSVEVALEVVVAVDGASDPVREIGGLTLEFER